jgi:hypothetical protein
VLICILKVLTYFNGNDQLLLQTIADMFHGNRGIGGLIDPLNNNNINIDVAITHYKSVFNSLSNKRHTQDAKNMIQLLTISLNKPKLLAFYFLAPKTYDDIEIGLLYKLRHKICYGFQKQSKITNYFSQPLNLTIDDATIILVRDCSDQHKAYGDVGNQVVIYQGPRVENINVQNGNIPVGTDEISKDSIKLFAVRVAVDLSIHASMSLLYSIIYSTWNLYTRLSLATISFLLNTAATLNDAASTKQVSSHVHNGAPVYVYSHFPDKVYSLVTNKSKTQTNEQLEELPQINNINGYVEIQPSLQIQLQYFLTSFRSKNLTYKDDAQYSGAVFVFAFTLIQENPSIILNNTEIINTKNKLNGFNQIVYNTFIGYFRPLRNNFSTFLSNLRTARNTTVASINYTALKTTLINDLKVFFTMLNNNVLRREYFSLVKFMLCMLDGTSNIDNSCEILKYLSNPLFFALFNGWNDVFSYNVELQKIQRELQNVRTSRRNAAFIPPAVGAAAFNQGGQVGGALLTSHPQQTLGITNRLNDYNSKLDIGTGPNMLKESSKKSLDVLELANPNSSNVTSLNNLSIYDGPLFGEYGFYFTTDENSKFVIVPINTVEELKQYLNQYNITPNSPNLMGGKKKQTIKKYYGKIVKQTKQNKNNKNNKKHITKKNKRKYKQSYTKKYIRKL